MEPSSNNILFALFCAFSTIVAPVLTVLYNLLKVHQRRLPESKGYFKLTGHRKITEWSLPIRRIVAS